VTPRILLFTDPPYNVDYEGYTEDHLTRISHEPSSKKPPTLA
jgi:DNA modification methylase